MMNYFRQAPLTMKHLFERALIFLVISFTTLTIHPQEVVKLDIDKSCKKCVKSKQFEDQVVANSIEVVGNILYKSYIQFAYKDRQQRIYFIMDQDMFKAFKPTSLEISIDGKNIIDVSQMVEFTKNQTIKGLDLEVVNIYGMGFHISDEVCDDILSAEQIEVSLLKSNSVRKTWIIKDGTKEDLQESLKCVKSISLPMIEEYKASLIKYPTNFRESKWNDNSNNVVEIEGEPFLKTEDGNYVYQVELNSDKFNAYFLFNNNKLWRGVYAYQGEYLNENKFYYKYQELAKILESKYGEPISTIKHRDKSTWSDSDEIGMAIQMGVYTEYRIWETEETLIKLEISGENLDTQIMIYYTTKDEELKTKVINQKTENSTKGF